ELLERGVGARSPDFTQHRERGFADRRARLRQDLQQRPLDRGPGLDERAGNQVGLDAERERGEQRPRLLARLRAQEMLIAALPRQPQRALEMALGLGLLAEREPRLAEPVVDARAQQVVLARLDA